MNKPITIIREEVKEKLANIINESGLPAFVIESILEKFLNEIRMIAKNQYEMDKTQYEQYLKNEAEKPKS